MIDVAPGTKVAVVELGGRGFTFATVKTVGKRDIVLDNGDRYRVTDQQRRVGGTWGTTYRLADPDSPEVVRLVLDRRIRNVARKIEGFAHTLAHGNDNNRPVAAAALAAASDRLTELVGQSQRAAP